MPTITFYSADQTDIERFQALLPAPDYQLEFVGDAISQQHSNSDSEVISMFVSDNITGEVMDRYPKLKLIATRSTGFDHIDLEAARERSPKGTFDFLGISADGEPLAIYNAQRVNLIDDDGRSHQQLPPESKGYYIQRPSERTRKTALATLPENVTLIRSLDEISELAEMQHTYHLPEQPHAYIPLNEVGKPVVRLGKSILSSISDAELDGLRG